MSDLNIAIYVSGKASRLRKLMKLPDQKLQSSIKLIVSDSWENQDLTNVLELRNITYKCFDFNKLKDDKNLSLSNLLKSYFDKLNIDYCFCFGDHILKGELLSTYKNKIINFHPSILPSYKGRMAIDKAISNGAFVIGNTAHFLSPEVDSGPIIMQNILHAKTFLNEGYDAVLDTQLIMVRQIFKWLKENRLKIRGEHVLIENANYNEIIFYPELDIQ